jgi:hypothetical protein
MPTQRAAPELMQLLEGDGRVFAPGQYEQGIDVLLSRAAVPLGVPSVTKTTARSICPKSSAGTATAGGRNAAYGFSASGSSSGEPMCAGTP